jgi:hypothetical protein
VFVQAPALDTATLKWSADADADVDGGSADPVIGEICGDGMVYDCVLTCISEGTVLAWIVDGYCDDGAWVVSAGLDPSCYGAEVEVEIGCEAAVADLSVVECLGR